MVKTRSKQNFEGCFMRVKRIISILCFVLLNGICVAQKGVDVKDLIYCVQVDALEKVFKEQLHFVESTDTAAIAKGETVSFQWVFRSTFPVTNLKIEAGDLANGDIRIPAGLEAFVGYVQATSDCHTCGNNNLPIKKIYDPISRLFPDPLLDIEAINVPALSNQPLWISYNVPRNAEAGIYSGEITISGEIAGKSFRLKKQITTKVYDVSLPEQTLWITNWYFPEYMSKMNRDQTVEPFSDRYWELLKILAHAMRDHGQNVYIIRSRPEFLLTNDALPEIIQTKIEGSQYTFDFTNFDKTVEFLMREGGLKRIEGSHLGSKMKGWGSDIGITVPGVGLRPLVNDTVRNYLSQFIPALYTHLRTKGWDKMYIQHIADEPSEVQSYIDVENFIRSLAPDMKVIEATIMGAKVANSVQVHVPIIWYYEKEADFYKAQRSAGNEVWYYISCDDPQGKYANRFYERELIQTRLLHWFNYRYNITGYLHWGFNYWQNVSGTPALYIDSNQGLPAGDICIVYPDYNKVYSSIRLEAQRDGIADYELLRLLEKKDPETAAQLASSIIRNYERYNTNIASFRETRLKLLAALSE
ncbi:hypothetical protein EZS27_025242 [termite gut metagenome]|uniref:Uncharacterized protein n=1 Tax=termite gut metagenome TaxID=433724 RepID=A0A5J4QXE4_9ZZZZ